jgi:PTS system ascorbate-specific IIA component
MKTGLLLITHGNIGRDMLDTVTEILGCCPLSADTLAVHPDSNPDLLYEAASRLCTELDQGDGVLVLTDLYGSTPSNIATRLTDGHNLSVISGVNIPMLIRVLNYPEMDMDALCEKAINGARDGIIVTRRKVAS